MPITDAIAGLNLGTLSSILQLSLSPELALKGYRASLVH